MAIDINEPIKQGSDAILNANDGSQRLGTADEFNKEAEKGNLTSLPPNDNPNGDPNSDSYKNSEKPVVSN